MKNATRSSTACWRYVSRSKRRPSRVALGSRLQPAPHSSSARGQPPHPRFQPRRDAERSGAPPADEGTPDGTRRCLFETFQKFSSVPCPRSRTRAREAYAPHPFEPVPGGAMSSERTFPPGKTSREEFDPAIELLSFQRGLRPQPMTSCLRRSAVRRDWGAPARRPNSRVLRWTARANQVRPYERPECRDPSPGTSPRGSC